MKTAIWFSRHQPTAEQIADASVRGYEITGIEAGMAAGAVNMTEQPDVLAAMDYCRGKVVFGVFPAPIRAAWREVTASAPEEAWESWNVQRTTEGGKPTFTHKDWVRVW